MKPILNFGIGNAAIVLADHRVACGDWTYIYQSQLAELMVGLCEAGAAGRTSQSAATAVAGLADIDLGL